MSGRDSLLQEINFAKQVPLFAPGTLMFSGLLNHFPLLAMDRLKTLLCQ